MRYFEKIPGERLFLAPQNPDDAEVYAKWLNDPAVAVQLDGYSAVFNLARVQKQFEEADDAHYYAVVLREGERLIGNVNLRDICGIGRTATLGVFIGEAEDRGKGYGAEAIRLMLGYGFDALNLNNVALEVFADNTQGIACYKKVGFREFGRRREATFHSGRHVDVVHMDILAREFTP